MIPCPSNKRIPLFTILQHTECITNLSEFNLARTSMTLVLETWNIHIWQTTVYRYFGINSVASDLHVTVLVIGNCRWSYQHPYSILCNCRWSNQTKSVSSLRGLHSFYGLRLNFNRYGIQITTGSPHRLH